MLNFIVLPGLMLVTVGKAIADVILNILNWATFLTFLRQRAYEIYRRHSIDVIVA